MSEEVAELIRLALVLLGCITFSVWVFRRYVREERSSSMAASIAELQNENATLRGEVARLKIAFDTVLAENQHLRCEIDKLNLEMAGLQDTLRSARNQADDWRAAAIGNKKP